MIDDSRPEELSVGDDEQTQARFNYTMSQLAGETVGTVDGADCWWCWHYHIGSDWEGECSSE